jgi:hypothetical protein
MSTGLYPLARTAGVTDIGSLLHLLLVMILVLAGSLLNIMMAVGGLLILKR